MRRLLDIDNPVMRLIIKLFDCMILSVLWVVFSLPVITMGAASTALYAAVYHHIRKDESYEKNYLLGKYGAIPTLRSFDMFTEA